MKNVFSGNPYDAQLAAMGAPPRKPAQDPRVLIDGIATKYNVPANLLIAMDEASGGKGLSAEQHAKAIAAGVSSGKSVEQVIAETAGDPARAAALMNRAYDIADELYPAPAAPAKAAGSSVAGDLARQLGGSIVKGGGSMVEGVGQGVDAAVNAAGQAVNPIYKALTGGDIGQTTMGRDAGVAGGDAVRGIGDGIQAGVSPEGRKAMMESTPDGDIFKPSTITLGKNPSLRGYAMLGADVLGSLLPVVATAIITKSPTAAAGVGGAMGGGAGAETARDIVQTMAKEIGPDGKSKLETESALYRELLAGGASPEQALDKVTREAERLAFLFTTPISAFGGAATGAILTKPVAGLAGKGIAARVAGKATLSGLEEGIQEAAESMAARYGTGQAAQMPIDITEGTFGDFILGALGGAPVGAIAGAANGRREPQPQEPPPAEQPAAPLALPAPNNGGTIFGAPPQPQEPPPPSPPPLGLPAPNRGGTIIGSGPVGPGPRDPTNFERDPSAPRQTLSDGSGQGQAAPPLSSPVPPPPGADGAAAPLGPISAIAAAAPDLTPIPEVEPVEVPPMFSEMKPGTAVRLQTPDGEVIDAVFQREEGESAVVRIGGQEVALDPAAFDTAVQGARQADLEAEAKAKGEKAPKSKAIPKPKPAKLTDQAVATVAPRAPEPDITPAQAAKAAKVIEGNAAKEGWTKGLRKKHENLITMAGEAYSPKPAGSADGPVRTGSPAPDAADQAFDPETGEVRQAGAEKGQGNPVLVASGAAPDGNVDGASAAGKRGNSLTAKPGRPDAVDYPNRKMNMRAARAEAPIDGIGDMEEGSFGSIALANGRAGDVLPGIGTISKVTDKQVQITKPDGSTLRVSEGSEKMNKLARDVGSLIASSANLRDEQLGSLMDMIERDPALVYRDGVPMLFDDPAEQSNRGQRSQRGGILRPLVSPKSDGAPAAPQTVADVPSSQGKDERGQSETSTRRENAQVSAAKPGLLSTLSQEKQDRAAFLQAKLAAKARNQTSSGLDPEYITLGGELVALYIEAGTKRFGQMLRDFAQATGLSLREAQAPMRAAYNHVRDDMRIDGKDVSDMDTADQVMDEVLKALAAEDKAAQPPAADPAPSDPAPSDADPFLAAGFTVGKDPAARALSDNREGKEGKWVVRQFGEGKYRVTKINKQAGSIAIPTRVIGNFDTAEEAIAAVRADGAPIPAPEVPTAKEVAAAATVTDPEPTKAQAEAENYRTGKVDWNGLTLSIENKKGGKRRGFKDDGSVAWEVTMPAHYGRILRTEGADGDHVDFYLGEVTDSDYVMIIDQVDAETGAFDEHKLILGTTARGAALGIYRDAFSDGKADKRIGGFTETTVGTLKAWLKSADMSKPSKPLSYPFAPKNFKTAAPGSDAEMKAALVKGLEGNPVTHVTKKGRELTGIIVVNPMLVPAQAEAIDARAFRKTGDNGGGWFIRADAARAYLGEDAPAAEIAKAQDAAPDAPATKSKTAKPKTETLQKRPLIHRVRSDIGQIDPDGTFGKEAYARGLNAQTAPFLFKRGGLKDLDNIPAAEHPEVAQIVGVADDGNYLDQDRLLELMLEEIAGNAQPVGNQAILQQEAREKDAQAAADRSADLVSEQEAGTGYVPVSAAIARDWFIPDPETDIRAGTAARYDDIRDAVAEVIEAYGFAALTNAEISTIVSQLDVAGGSVLAAIEQTYVRGQNDEASISTPEPSAGENPDFTDPPFGPEDAARYLGSEEGGTGTVGEDWPGPSESGAGSGGQGNPETTGEVTFEPGADGKPQAIMPGMEGGAEQRKSALTARQKAEIEARQKQSKMRRLGGNEGDAGPLFGDGPKDLFDAPTAREPDFVDRFNSAKITDFGEKIGGARKDVWAGFKEKMDEAEALDVAKEPLSKSWPEPDYEKLIEAGVDPWTVSFVRAARDMIPRKPGKSWKLKGWAEQVKVLRTFANGILNERIDQANLKAKLEAFPDLNKKIGGKIALYDAVGHGQSLKELDFGEHTYSVLGGQYFSKPRTFWEVTKEQAATVWSNMPKTLARGDTREEALASFKAGFRPSDATDAIKKKSGTKFLIYSQRGAEGAKYKIGVKIGSNYFDLRTGIAEVKEARRIVAEESDQLQEKLDAMRTIPNERREENSPRLGADHRAGADVSPEQFGETFGFRGVEFGNSVEQNRRKQDLNEAYDALMDLASILDIPPKAISLNGSLGLAFGARGTGGKNAFAAHYEPGKVVINLTKRSGRGSLAHEWFHALDNYFARKRAQQRGTYITDNSSPGGPLTDGIRPETVDAFLAVKRAIANTELKKRSAELDKLRSKPYFGTGVEMHARAFESYIIAKLQDQSASNDYLANIVNGLSWSMLAEASGLGDAYPYLKANEIETVRPKFDALFAGMERRETDKGVALEMREDAPGDSFITQFMQELAQVDDLFQNPVSKATTLKGVFADIDPSITMDGVLAKDDPRIEGKDADKVTLFKTDKDKPFYVYETRGEVWIDVSDLGKGDGGSRVYSAVSDYALNVGRVFIGDPEGLSAAALRRRTDNMLSTAIKHGTTRHIEPHQYQKEGDAKLGVPAMRWTDGDDVGNMESLIEVSVANLISHLPEVADARYDFTTGAFRTSEGQPITDGDLDKWTSAAAGNRAARIGRATLKRGILLNSLARAESQDRPGLLERALRQQRQLVARGLSRTFYMREDAPPVANLTGDELGAWDDIRQLGKKAEKWYRDNLSGKTAVNADKNWTVTFTNAGARKVGGRKGEDLYRMVPALRQIIESGVVILTEPDTKGNETVRAWHTISARVEMDGRVFAVVAKVKETSQGHFHYDLSGDSEAGARFGTSISPESRAYGLEDNPDEINLQFSSAEINADDAPITDDDMRGITRDMNAELAASGLAGKVSVRVVRNLISRVSGDPIQGRFNDGAAGIEVRAGAAAGERGVMRHEIIHALRSETLWNKPGGLFTPAEWRELARAAQAEPEIVASVKARYPNLDRPAQVEEMVAELYRLWADQRDGYDGVSKALAKVEAFIVAMANLLRGRGFVSAARTMDQIAGGKIGGRGPQGPGGATLSKTERVQDGAEMRAIPGTVRDKFKGLVGFRNWRDPKQFVSDALTDAMANGRYSLLGLVPGRPLFTELAKKLPSAAKYVDSKQAMDTERNEWHARAATVMDRWSKAHKAMPQQIEKLHDLMFRVTISGIDPRQPDVWEKQNPDIAGARAEVAKKGDRASAKAKSMVKEGDNRAKAYATMKAEFDALPQEAKDIFDAALNELVDLDAASMAALEKAISDNAALALKRAEKEFQKSMAQINDQGLEGQEAADAKDVARGRLEKAKARFAANQTGETMKSLRKDFESARLSGPYFPLYRSGKFFVAARGADRALISFQMVDSVKKQRAEVAKMQAEYPDAKVSTGLSADRDALREVVDPRFVSDVEMLLADSGASEGLMDAVWQRYLQTMPEQSLRTNAIHRKSIPGYNKDALRAFSSHMFHGAHQTMRLKYAAELETAIMESMEQAAISEDRNRAEAVVQEMARRKEWALAPQNAPWVSWAGGITFLWYLGVSPAAALVNVTQTTVIGPAMMKARFKSASVSRIMAELGKASQDFMRGQGASRADTWSAENAPGLTDDEREAIREGYKQGTIDKTQAHDLASVAESGVEYNSSREKVMRWTGFFYHHAERFNREVTFLASYRLARAEGMDFKTATDAAKAATWDTHFSYANSDRPRFMQGDFEKVLLGFKQYSTNLIYRMWRDAHQAFHGATPEDRAEAKTQLVGITLSMFAHAGIKGVWGYGLLMGLAALFLPGDAEDIEEWMERALIKEGDDVGTAAWNFAMGAALNGLPGQASGIALSQRIGSPDLWIRSPSSDLEGEDLAMHYLKELSGPTLGIGINAFRAGSLIGDGEIVRGVEAATPKFLRDIIKTGRFASEGVTTMRGDQIIENVNPWELIVQFNGFSPARLDEAYEDRGYLYLVQDRIETDRRKLHKKAGDAIKEGQPVSQEVMDEIAKFNAKYPFFPVTGDSIKRSYRSRLQANERTVGGANLNPKLDNYLRDLVAPAYR